jgi:ATP-dependent Clp protease ATP-binding subunit ClpA
VLFDEVEKADRTVLRALLQVLDMGELRLANGQQTISFRNSYLFLTSNLGSAELVARARPSFARRVRRSDRDIVQRALEGFFDPEFFNRIDETVIFEHFDRATAHEVARLEIDRLRTRLVRRSVSVDVEDAVVALIGRTGFDPVYGARGLQRVLRRTLAEPVAEAILLHRPVGTEPLSLRARAIDGLVRIDRPEPAAQESEFTAI